MTTYVLVAGAWLGGWAWQPVTDQLGRHGHDVHPVTFTGLGDRAHLASPEVDLDTYIADVVDLVERRASATSSWSRTATPGTWSPGWPTGSPSASPARLPRRGPEPDGAAFMDLQPPPPGS